MSKQTSYWSASKYLLFSIVTVGNGFFAFVLALIFLNPSHKVLVGEPNLLILTAEIALSIFGTVGGVVWLLSEFNRERLAKGVKTN